MCDFQSPFRKMDYYTDRCTKDDFSNVADRCEKGDLNLWNSYYFNINGYAGNIFSHEFDTDAILKREYLFAMDYLTCVLTGYKISGKEVYKETFEKIINQFYEYSETNGPFYSELPIYAQTLLFIKALDIFGNIPHQDDFFELLKKYADWLTDDNNYFFDNNHGLFEDLALLHLSILFEMLPQSKLWQEHAIHRVNKLYEVAYYNDFTNNEHSISYFSFNNYLYEQIIRFCKYYSIAGIEKIENGIGRAKETLTTFAHKDTSLPLIGDGRIFNSKESNNYSALFPDIGIAIVKIGEAYMSFKCKTVFQSHAHTDISSITARYKNIDFIIDSGQYNYDRYSPINRFLRSSGGHSGLFPVYADGLFQKDFCDLIKHSGITVYEHNGDNAHVKGEYRLNDIEVCREIFISINEIIVKDSWSCQNPTVLRQRFIIPKELIERSRFTASQGMLESKYDNVKFRYEIMSESNDILSTVSFGVAAPQYDGYETTMMLDTIAQNTISGEITAKIGFVEES